MSQKFIKTQNKIKDSKSFGKYYAKAVYDVNFIGTEELGEFIQTQCSVKKSDIKAVLQELGEAMKRRHRHLQGGILQHRRRQARAGQRHDHHPPPRPLRTRDGAHRGRSDGEQSGRHQTEVRQRQVAAQGRCLRRDTRECLP